MGLKDCLAGAEERGAISREERSFLERAFDERFAQRRLEMGDVAARAKAREDLEAALRAEAAEKKRRADLMEATRLNVKGYMQGYRDRDGQANVYEAAMALLSHYGFRATSSVRGRAESIIAGAHSRMSEVMFAFERKGVLGKRANRALQSKVVAELHGEASGDATARSLGLAIAETFEDLRQRFNAAGGSIGKLEKWGLPHSHDRLKVKRATRETWKGFIRELIDPARMRHPLTGQALTPAELEASLDHVFDSIVSNNRAHLQPTATRRGLGAVASQRQDERFLVFRDAASWQAYNARFGKGDVVQAIFNHVNGMARDIAAMEMLGPNPAAMVEYLKQVVALEIGKRETGKPSLVGESRLFPDSQAKLADYRIDALWQSLRGRPEIVSGAAGVSADIRNLLTSAQLGSTAILAGATDPFIARAARMLAGLPATSTIRNLAAMVQSQTRREAYRSGLIWDEYLHVMQDELRFSGPAVGSDWSRWLADRAVTWSGLKPLTTGRRLVEARFIQSHIAEISGRQFQNLDRRFRTMLEGFGVGQPEWDIWRQSIDPLGFVTAAEIERRGGGVQYIDMRNAPPAQVAAETRALAHRRAAEKLSELISSWSERSVPTGTPNARSIITGKVERGTFAGELIDYFLQYKSFGLSFTTMQLEAIGEMAAARGGGRGRRSGLGYFAALAVPLTLGGAVYLQIKAVLDGKEPASMDPQNNPGFWLQAAFTGGGFGLFGDFVKGTENRFGQSLIESLAGPGVTFIGDVGKLTLGNAQEFLTAPELWRGDPKAALDETKLGREATQFLRRYTPVISSHWATRGAYNRIVLDNLQYLLDPEADKSFKAMARTAKENGTPYFIAPGSRVAR